MLCMGYSDNEIDDIKNKDFTTYFMCTLGARPNVINVLTIVHHKINFDDAEKSMLLHKINNSIILKFVSYEFLKDIKLKSMRTKDLLDIAQLEKLRKL
jgi:hypothetical protein